MAQLIALVVPLVLALLILTTMLPLLTRWVHPIRVLTIALTCGFSLLLLSLIVPLVGVVGWIWIALVVLAAVGAAVANVRALRTAPPVARPRDGSRKERRRAARIGKLASRPSWGETIATALIFLALLAAAAFAG